VEDEGGESRKAGDDLRTEDGTIWNFGKSVTRRLDIFQKKRAGEKKTRQNSKKGHCPHYQCDANLALKIKRPRENVIVV